MRKNAVPATNSQVYRPGRVSTALPEKPPIGPGLLLVVAVLLLPCGALAYRHGPLWWRFLLPHRPPGIIIHHSGTPSSVAGQPLTAAAIDQAHARRGWGRLQGGRVYHIGYHYVVQPTGQVESGRPETMPGAHCDGHNDMLGICLVGDFTKKRPTDAQLRAAVALTRRLLAKYGLTPAQVYRHCDLDATACPGAAFPWTEFRRDLAAP